MKTKEHMLKVDKVCLLFLMENEVKKMEEIKIEEKFHSKIIQEYKNCIKSSMKNWKYREKNNLCEKKR